MLVFSGFGRLTKDPVVRVVGDTNVCEFSIAINKKIGDREITDFFDMELWGKGGETFAKYTEKGQNVFLTGSPKQDRWEDKDGSKRNKVVFLVEKFKFLSSSKPVAEVQPFETTQEEPKEVSQNVVDEVSF